VGLGGGVVRVPRAANWGGGEISIWNYFLLSTNFKLSKVIKGNSINNCDFP
jgi:hypothetical protein